jgi:hypothetical protein
LTASESLSLTLSDSIPITDTLTEKILSKSLVESLNIVDDCLIITSGPKQFINNCQTQITVDQNHLQLVVLSSNVALSTITIPSTVTAPELDYSSIVQPSGSSNTVQISNALTINKDTTGNSNADVKVTIPAGITITGPHPGIV